MKCNRNGVSFCGSFVSYVLPGGGTGDKRGKRCAPVDGILLLQIVRLERGRVEGVSFG